MLLYYSIYILLAVFTFFTLRFRNVKVERVIAVVICIGIIFMGTVRWKTGFDWYFYYTYLRYLVKNDVNLATVAVGFEPLFTSFYFVAKYTGLGFIVVQFLQIFFITTLKFSVFKKYTPYLVLALFLNYCFYLDAVTVRNYLAASICLTALPFIERKKFIPFALITITSCFIHLSSILYILAYFIFYWKANIPIRFSILILSVIIGQVGIFETVFTTLNNAIGEAGGRASDKLNAYMNMYNQNQLSAVGANTFMVVMGILRRLVIIPFIFYYEHKYFKNDRLFKGLSSLFLFGNIIYFIVGSEEFQIFQRMAIPFYFMEVIILCKIYAVTRYKPIILTFLLLYGLIKLFAIVNGNMLIVPYISIFDPDVYQEFWDMFKPPRPFEIR